MDYKEFLLALIENRGYKLVTSYEGKKNLARKYWEPPTWRHIMAFIWIQWTWSSLGFYPLENMISNFIFMSSCVDKLKNDRKMNAQIPRNTSVKPEPSESPEEHERDVNIRASSEESKDCLAKCSSVTVSQIKWDREDISSESKSGMDDCRKIGSSPKIRKKGSLKTGNDNQSTLFQYLGRK